MNSTTMEWTRGHTIGRGSSATVSVAKAHRSNELFAVKSTELLQSEFLKREQKILSLLKSNRVIGYLGSDITSENGKLIYNLFMEYISGGTLTDSIRNNGGCLDENSIKSITFEILQGLEYLHSKGLVHCDIKGSNVLIGNDGVKIGDLGCARWIDATTTKKPVIAGTPLFMAPEVARGDEQGFPADVWALGCTVIEMATGRPPWPEAVDPVSALYRIGFSGELPEFPSFLSEEAKDFLSKCLRRDPGKRWSVNQLLQHSFLKESNSSYSKQIEEPKKSISPSSILDQAFWDSMEVSETPTNNGFSSNSAIGRLQKISSPKKPNWTEEEEEEEDNWVTIRSDESSNFSTEDHNLSSSVVEEPTTNSGSESDWIDQDEEEEEAEEIEFEKVFSSRRRRDSRRSRIISVRRDSVKISKLVCKDLIFERKRKFISSLNPIFLEI